MVSVGGRRTSEKSGWGPIDTSPSSSSANGCTKVGWEERRGEGGRTTCVKIDFRSCYSILLFSFSTSETARLFDWKRAAITIMCQTVGSPYFFREREKKLIYFPFFLPVPFRKSSPMLRVVRFSLPAIDGEGAIS